MQQQKAGELWTPSRIRADDPFTSALRGYDLKPRVPNSANLEVAEQAPDVIPPGWAVVGNSGGSAPTLQTVGGYFDNLAPSTNSHSINSDAPGKWLMVPAGAKVILAYRSFVPGAATKFAVVAKLNIFRFGTATADDRIALTIDKTVPSSTVSDAGTDSLTVEYRPYAGTPDFNSVKVDAGVAGARTSVTGSQPGLPTEEVRAAYLAITCETSDALSTWCSRDGFAWTRIQRYTAGNIIANVNYAFVAVRDDTGSAAVLGGFEWIRFLVGDNRAWKLGFGG